jgi:hypothetical protein
MSISVVVQTCGEVRHGIEPSCARERVFDAEDSARERIGQFTGDITTYSPVAESTRCRTHLRGRRHPTPPPPRRIPVAGKTIRDTENMII